VLIGQLDISAGSISPKKLQFNTHNMILIILILSLFIYIFFECVYQMTMLKYHVLKTCYGYLIS
jgi:hypothetical protein